jgi:hypothetical protein
MEERKERNVIEYISVSIIETKFIEFLLKIYKILKLINN